LQNKSTLKGCPTLFYTFCYSYVVGQGFPPEAPASVMVQNFGNNFATCLSLSKGVCVVVGILPAYCGIEGKNPERVRASKNCYQNSEQLHCGQGLPQACIRANIGSIQCIQWFQWQNMKL